MTRKWFANRLTSRLRLPLRDGAACPSGGVTHVRTVSSGTQPSASGLRSVSAGICPLSCAEKGALALGAGLHPEQGPRAFSGGTEWCRALTSWATVSLSVPASQLRGGDADRSKGQGIRYRVPQKEGLRACSGRGDNMGVIVHSFNWNISPEMSYCMLECDSVMLQNDVLTIL